MSKKLTIYDIANLAGVSPATVSRVIHNADYVKESTRQKVRDAFTLSGITPDELDFKQRESKKLQASIPRVPVILVYIPVWNNPFYSDILQGIHAYIHDLGYKMVVTSATLDKYHIDEFLEFTASMQISGIITAGRFSEDVLQTLYKRFPLVQCSEYNPVCMNIPYVTLDDYSITKKAVSHLASLGCKKIGFFSSSHEFQFVQNRFSAYKSALNECNLSLNPEYIVTVSGLAYDRILSSANIFFNGPNPPDGIFAVSDQHAHAVVKAANMAKIKIPDDLKVIGFDDTMYSSLSNPAISTVRQPKKELGRQSARILIEMIENPGSTAASVILPGEMCLRQTT